MGRVNAYRESILSQARAICIAPRNLAPKKIRNPARDRDFVSTKKRFAVKRLYFILFYSPNV